MFRISHGRSRVTKVARQCILPGGDVPGVSTEAPKGRVGRRGGTGWSPVNCLGRSLLSMLGHCLGPNLHDAQLAKNQTSDRRGSEPDERSPSQTLTVMVRDSVRRGETGLPPLYERDISVI